MLILSSGLRAVCLTRTSHGADRGFDERFVFVGLQYICYTVAYPEQEGEKGKVAGNQTENLPLGGGAELQKRW